MVLIWGSVEKVQDTDEFLENNAGISDLYAPSPGVVKVRD